MQNTMMATAMSATKAYTMMNLFHGFDMYTVVGGRKNLT
jgi:hypothetical protein